MSRPLEAVVLRVEVPMPPRSPSPHLCHIRWPRVLHLLLLSHRAQAHQAKKVNPTEGLFPCGLPNKPQEVREETAKWAKLLQIVVTAMIMMMTMILMKISLD
eukprot:Rmarinus@m.7181